jgi:hypothetical protein
VTSFVCTTNLPFIGRLPYCTSPFLLYTLTACQRISRSVFNMLLRHGSKKNKFSPASYFSIPLCIPSGSPSRLKDARSLRIDFGADCKLLHPSSFDFALTPSRSLAPPSLRFSPELTVAVQARISNLPQVCISRARTLLMGFSSFRRCSFPFRQSCGPLQEPCHKLFWTHTSLYKFAQVES